jgi:hypothetical protein
LVEESGNIEDIAGHNPALGNDTIFEYLHG